MKKLLVITTVMIFFCWLTSLTASGEVLVVGTTDRITTLDPADSYDYWSSNVIFNTHDGLVETKPGGTEIEPVLAKNWKVSRDGLTYTFFLREGVTFTDGTPFDANAVKYSLERTIKLGGDPAFLIADVITNVTVVDRYTLEIKLKKPDATFLGRLAFTCAFPISPTSAPADKFTTKWTAGTGPYKVVEYVPEERVVYELYENYWGPKPKITTIVEIFYADATALRLAIETGEVDVAFRTFEVDDVTALEKKSGLKVIRGEKTMSIRYNVFNVTQPPFDNKLVRQAISYAMNRKAICDRIFAGVNKPLYSMVPPGLWSHIDAFPERDLEKARELLKQAGYSEKNPLKITLWYTPKHYGTMEADVAVVEATSLEETNMIKVDIKYAEWATYIDYFTKGILGFFLLGWYPDYIDPDNYVDPFVSTSGGKSLGTFYSSPAMDALLITAREVVDIETRVKLYEKIQKIISEEVPVLPLWFNVLQHIAVVKEDVKGVLLDPSMWFRYSTISKE